jgi:hypothetical protein
MMLVTVRPRGVRARALCLAAFAGAFAARAGTGPAAASAPVKHATFETFREAVSAPVFGDLPEAPQARQDPGRRHLSKTHYFVDKGQQRGSRTRTWSSSRNSCARSSREVPALHHRQVLPDPGISDYDRTLFAFAAYNAGPTRVRSLRRKAAKQRLDPNVWFGNVEVVASQVVGTETVHDVSNISKYYLAYRMIESRRDEKKPQAAR